MSAQLNSLALAWWEWMGAMFWQVSLLIVIIATLDMLIRKWVWPQVRYALWLLILVKLVVPPDWSLRSSIVSYFRPALEGKVTSELGLTNLDTRAGTITTQEPADASATRPLNMPAVAPSPEPGKKEVARMPEREEKLSIAALALIVWFSGIVVFMSILFVKMKRLRNWHSKQKDRSIPPWFHEMLLQTATRLQLQRLPAIVFSNESVTPAVYGILRPVMLLPANYFDNLNRDEAEHVLLHELAHLKRGDLWLHGICLFLQIVYWFNPLLIYVRRQMKHVREICCDLTVANVLREKTAGYRQTLLNTARELLSENVEPGLGLLGVFEEPFKLVSRLKWLEKKTWTNRYWMRGTAILVALLVMFCILPMAGREQVSKAGTAAESDEEMVLERFQLPPSGRHELDVTIKKLPRLYAAVLPMRGNYDQAAGAVKELRSRLQSQGIKPIGSPFGRFFSDPEKVPERLAWWEVGLQIPEGTKVSPPLEVIKVTEQQVAGVVVEGLDETDVVWKDFIERITDRGYIPAYPPAVEIWPGDALRRRTEMQIQVLRPDAAYPSLTTSVKEIEPVKAVVVSGHSYYNSQIENGLRQLAKYCKENEIKPAGFPFGRFYSSAADTPIDECLWEIGVPVSEDVTVEWPFEVKEFEGGKIGSANSRGALNTEYPWSVFAVKLVLKGNIPVPPAIEIWKGNLEDLETGEFETEMQIPIMFNYGDVGKNLGEGGKDFVEAMSDWGQRLGHAMRDWGEKISEHASEDLDTNFRFGEKEVPGFHAVVLPMRGSYDQLLPAMHRLQTWMISQQIEPTGPSFMRQLSDPRVEHPEFDFTWEVGYPVASNTKVSEPFEKRKFEETLVSYIKISGRFIEDDLNQDWAKWALVSRSRPSGAALLYCPDKLYKGSYSTWEIHIPIEKMDKDFPDIDIATENRDASVALVLPMSGSWRQEPGALEKLQNYIEKHKIVTRGKPFIRYFNDYNKVPEEEYLWEIGTPVQEGTQAKAPFEIKYFPKERIAYAVMKYDEDKFMDQCYSLALRAMIHGYFSNDYVFMILEDGSLKQGMRRKMCVPVREKRSNQSELPKFM